MTNSQKHALRLSQISGRLNEIGLLEGDAYSEEVRGEETTLQTEDSEVRQRYNSALISEGDEAQAAATQFTGDTSEDRAYRQMVDSASLGGIFTAAIENRSTTGAEAELQQFHKLAANQVPLALAVEHRAVTPGPANVGVQENAVIQPVFALGDAAYFGVDQPTVPAGDAVFPVLKTRPTVSGPHTDSTSVSDTTGAFDSDLLTPARLQAEFTWKRTSAARFRGMDDALRLALNGGLSEAVDQQVVSGTNGLLTGTNLANHAAAAVTSFATYVSQLVTGRVDGRHASRPKDIKLLVGSDTYGHASALYRTTESEQTAVDRLMELAGDLRVSAHMPATAAHKQNAVVRLGMRRDMIAPMWEGITLIPDEITKKDTGEIVLTAVLLHAIKILRPSGFYKQQTQHA